MDCGGCNWWLGGDGWWLWWSIECTAQVSAAKANFEAREAMPQRFNRRGLQLKKQDVGGKPGRWELKKKKRSWEVREFGMEEGRQKVKKRDA
jgi:hypothetical protein